MDRLNTGSAEALTEVHRGREVPAHAAHSLLLAGAAQPSPQERVARIVRLIEADIIPRLLRSHRPAPEAPPTLPRAPMAPLAPTLAAVPLMAAVAVLSVPPVLTEASQLDGSEIASFVQLVLHAPDAGWMDSVAALRARGLSVETLYLDLLQPAARELGRMWDDDTVMFSDVTVAVGRLHRIMRSLTPAFGSEIDVPADGRRALLIPAPGEQHTFGLSMVAEFFRRAGWDVVCDLDSRAVDPVAMVRSEWFDVVGISAGATARLDWLKSGIAAVRHASRNRAVGVMVGGPVFAGDASLAVRVGADATASDGRQAPILAERLLDERARRL